MKSFPLKEVVVWVIVVGLLGGMANLYAITFTLREDFVRQTLQVANQVTSELGAIRQELVRLGSKLEQVNERKMVVDHKLEDHEDRIRGIENKIR